MNLSRTPLTELTASPESFGKVKAFYGKTKQPRRDILEKPPFPPTSDGVKTVGFGNPRNPAKKNVRRWTKGELRTPKKAPTGLNKLKPPIPRPPPPQRRRFVSSVTSDVNLSRTPLLFDHHDEG